ncbi:DUF456 domain-containing protein [Lysobacter sp. SG-8]|uniref:DUF456 domain-containing protein n=1 Tax=Marilutibacter penaei TaxID=2759900 RepID=A0A7W3YFE9_9GAMM|nr:DUF456 domain-containing protein [Lysobacter penaei]MBB1089161.1 DUF456 domain-containing protein [Lysobacter penaei]
MDIQTLYYTLAALLIVIGIAGTVLPALPGVPLVFIGMLLAAWAGDFAHVGWMPLLALGLMTVLSLLVDVLATALGAKRVGASRLAIIGAMVGTIVGLFFGLVGIFVGPFVGAVLGELIHGRRVGHSARVGIGTWLGILVGTVFKIGLAFAMLGLFVLALFF